MNTIIQDFHFALRRLRSDGAFTLGVLAMLALGLAVSVAMFSVLRGVVMSALPYPDAERVVSLEAVNAEQGVVDGNLTTAEAVRFAAEPTPFEALGYYTWGGITVVEGGEPREITVNPVSAGFFPALGIKPLHGRWIEARDAATDGESIVLSYTEWQRIFGGDPAAIGKLIDTDRGRLEVLGVMPPAFGFPGSDVGGWQPISEKAIDPSRPGYWQARFVSAVARVAPGISTTQLDERMAQIVGEVRETHGIHDNGWRVAGSPLLEEMVASVRPVLWGAFAIALLVLLIACVNSAILLDARLVRRARELAIAQALGAGYGRLRRILAFELGVIVAAASAIAVGLIAFTLERFRTFAADRLPRAEAIALDGEGVGFALAAGAMALALIALQGWRLRAQPAAALRSAGTGFGTKSTRRRWRLLPAVGIALSTIGVASAVALALSLAAMQSVDPGFRTQNVFVLQLFRSGDPAGWSTFAEQTLERLRALPGVEAAELSTSLPMSGIGTFAVDIEKPGSALCEPLQARVRRVSAGYTGLLDIPVVEGRRFDDGDRAGSEPVTLVSHSLARRVFGEATALDQRIAVPLGRGPPIEHRIIGVMADTQNDTLRTAPQPELIVPFAQSPWLGMSFLVRGATLDASILRAMQTEVWAIDPREGITRAFALDDDLELQLAPSRFFAATIGLFALASLLLGALGVYAVTAFVQRERTPEYGLKLAIGAPPRAMAREIFGETLVVAVTGLAFGLVGAAASLRLLSGQLFEIGASDVAAYAAAVVTIATTALLAAAAPALRAARIDPMQALRNE